jgi:tRNA (mo5U34)-methyltransferase
MQRARNADTTETVKRWREELAQLGWYHSIELPDGRILRGHQTIAQLKERIARYPIPQDLTGKRVLDIGAWDGWFSFEMERRGATVVAVDSSKQKTFLQARELLNSKAEYIVEDVCRLSPRDIGYFDIVLFFGVLYHLKHPLLALEKICELSTDMACIESLVIEDSRDRIPLMEFYEGTECAGQFDNWCAPNPACLMAFCRTAGFARVDMKGVIDNRAHVVGYRKWPQIRRSGAGPELVCIENTWTRDHNFAGDRDEYLTVWFNSKSRNLDCDNVFVQAGPYGCRPVGVRNVGAIGWQVNCKLAPGLSRGWHDVSVSVHQSEWSSPSRIPIDLPRHERRIAGPVSESLKIAAVADGKVFEPNRVRVGAESCVTVWASGLPESVTNADVSLRLDGADLPVVYISAADAKGLKQVNAMVPPGSEPGEYVIAMHVRGVESRPVPVQLF